MVSKTQNVRFESYVAMSHDKNDKEVNFNIEPLILAIKELNDSQRLSTYFGEPVRMDKIHEVILSDQAIQLYPKLSLTYFHMAKLRDEGVATTTKKTDELTDLDLDEDEYIAEDISCFYDSLLNSIFIQRNFHSLSIAGVCEYLITEYEKIQKLKGNDKPEKLDLFFRPVPDKAVLKNAKKVTNYRNITLKFANNNLSGLPKGLTGVLGGLGTIFNNVGGLSAGLTISAGDSKAPSLTKKTMQEFIDAVGSNNSLFSSAIINGKRGDMPVEKFDLLNGKLCTVHKFASVKDKEGKKRKLHLNPNSVEDIMKLIYLTKDNGIPFRDEIVKNLG